MPKREMSVAKVVMVGGRVVAVLEQDKYVVPDWFPLALGQKTLTGSSVKSLKAS